MTAFIYHFFLVGFCSSCFIFFFFFAWNALFLSSPLPPVSAHQIYPLYWRHSSNLTYSKVTRKVLLAGENLAVCPVSQLFMGLSSLRGFYPRMQGPRLLQLQASPHELCTFCAAHKLRALSSPRRTHLPPVTTAHLYSFKHCFKCLTHLKPTTPLRGRLPIIIQVYRWRYWDVTINHPRPNS